MKERKKEKFSKRIKLGIDQKKERKKERKIQQTKKVRN